MQRRDFLRLSGLAVLPLVTRTVLPAGLSVWAGPSDSESLADDAAAQLGAAADGARWDRVLILVELAGGNDGLNTVVPHADDAYYRARPTLAVKKHECLTLDDALGLNPALAPLHEIWQAHKLALVLGVGYANPNRSHFRSIEIWETGSDSDEVRQDGWLADVFRGAPRPAQLAAESIILGPKGDAGAVAGVHMRNLVMQDPTAFSNQAKRLAPASGVAPNPALAHLNRVRVELRDAASRIEQRLKATPRIATQFPKTPLGRQLETAARLVISGVPVLVIKATLTGFDTHTQQSAQQTRLLTELAAALGALRTALIAGDQWQRVLIMTYSEFGRRVAENGARGTDHGTAAPHFLAGGVVKGGLYGKQPSLTDLLSGDLKHAVDYRRLYSTIAKEWWQLPTLDDTLKAHAPLECIAATTRKRDSF